MAGCLLDTNLLLRIADATAHQHQVARQAIGSLLAAGEQIVLTPQNFIEFWAVATRPLAANELG